jgi:hypothetical protein
METVHFLGRVLPPVYNVSVGFDPKIRWSEAALNFDASFVVHIKNSTVDVECELDPFRLEQYPLLYIRAFDKARTAVDLVAFATGFSLTTVLDSFVHANGTQEPIAFSNPPLSQLCKAFRVNGPPTDKSFDEVYRIVASEHELFMALRDLIDANTLPHIGVINCGRVLDGIKRMISPGVTDQSRAWAAMQTALNISRSYQQWVTELSSNPRHADRSYITGPDSQQALGRAWTIMNRFLEYRKRGNSPLAPPDFPTLNP